MQRRLSSAPDVLAAPFLFLLAFLPRLAALGRYVTPDELNWVYRSLGLRQALLAGEWANTIQSGHPGVVTTWIGALAIQLELWLEPAAQAHLIWLEKLYWLSTSNAEAYRHLYAFLNSPRLGVALATSLGIVLLYHTGSSVVGRGGAFLGALFLALDPFTAGLSGLFHVDALLATFMLLALLLALRSSRELNNSSARRGNWYAVACGVTTALALLNKTPGFFLLAFVPAVLLLAGPERISLPNLHWRRRAMHLLLWSIALAAMALLLLPALWTAPSHVLDTMAGLTGRLVNDAVRPTFFLGEMALEHGPLFYPLVLPFRLSPAATLGLLLALGLLLRELRRQAQAAGAVSAVWLLLFSFGFLLFISLVAKKFDRYALPALFSLTFVSGWGIATLGKELDHRGRLNVARWLPLIVVVLQGAYLVTYLPFPLHAANWLAGGPVLARRVLPLGWEESASIAAQTLARQVVGPTTTTLFSSNLAGTAPFFPGPVMRLQPTYLPLLQEEDYLLPDDGGQEKWPPATLLQQGVPQLAAAEPQRTMVYTGLEAADFDLPALEIGGAGYRFGDAIDLLRWGHVFLPWPEGTLVALDWERRPAAGAAYQLQLQLVDEEGQVRASQEVPLLNDVDQAPLHWEPEEPYRVFYRFVTSPYLPPGPYRLQLALFDEAGARLGVFDAPGTFVGNSAALGALVVRPPASQPAPEMEHVLPGLGNLAGYGKLPAQASNGDLFSLDLWWRATGEPTAAFDLLLGASRLPAEIPAVDWVAGQIYQLRPRWRLPAELPAGSYPVAIQVVGRKPVLLGELMVEAIARNFDLPAGLEPLQVQFGSVAQLQGVEAEVGSEINVELLWQAMEPDEVAYTAFVHLRDSEGEIVTQQDRPLQPLSSSWAKGQVIQESYTLPRPAPGDYTLAIGLYDSSDGLRLPAYNSRGRPLADEQYLVEVSVP